MSGRGARIPSPSRRRNRELVLVGAAFALRPFSFDRTGTRRTGPFAASADNFDAAADAIAPAVQIEAVPAIFGEGAVHAGAGISCCR